MLVIVLSAKEFSIKLYDISLIFDLWLENFVIYHLFNFCKGTWSNERFFKCKITILFCIYTHVHILYSCVYKLIPSNVIIIA